MPDVTDGVRISIKDFLSLSSVIHDAERDKRRRGPVHPLQARVYSSSSYFFFSVKKRRGRNMSAGSLSCVSRYFFSSTKKRVFFSLHVDCLVKVNSRVRKKQTGYRHTTPRVSLTIQPFCVGQKKRLWKNFSREKGRHCTTTFNRSPSIWQRGHPASPILFFSHQLLLLSKIRSF